MSDNFIDINEIEPSGHPVDCRLGPVRVGEAADPLEILTAELVGGARRTVSGARLQGRLAARIKVVCSRCLVDVEIPINQQVELDLLLDSPRTPSGEVRVEAGDTLGFPADEGRVDLREVAAEQIYLHLPLKVLCGSACKGLCPACGENRNRLECDCRTADLDPRLSPLADLKRRMERG